MRYLLILSLFFLNVLSLSAEGIVLPPGLQARFLQKITNPQNKVIQYSGTVLMDRGNRFKWRYMQPSRKEVCSDGQRVVVVDHDLEQVSLYRMDKGVNLGEILKRAKHYKGRLYTAKFQGRTYTLELDEKGRIDQIAYRDDMDNVVNIRLMKIRALSKAPSTEQMRCPYPKSYDVIGG